LDSTSFVAAYYDGQVRSAQDYYAFGWNIPSRKFNTGSYRHGFNGKENDNDFGEQLIQDYGFRIYNPSIGKFLSVDPLAPDYPSWTPYAFAMNRVIDGIDLDGLEWDSYLNQLGGMSDAQLREGLSNGEGGENPIQARPRTAFHKGFSWMIDNTLVPAISVMGDIAQIPSDAVESATSRAMEGAGWEFGKRHSFEGPIQYEQDIFYSTYNEWRILGDAIPKAVGEATGIMIDIAVTRKGSPSVNEHLKSAVNQWARSHKLLKTLPKSSKFNTATIAYDKVSRKAFFGRNGGIKISNSDIHPVLKEKLPNESLELWKVDNCAECDAINQALHNGAKWENLKMHTIGVKKDGGTFVKPKCKNCQKTFDDIELIE
jgi:RHS repeat-associated protein